MKINLFSESAFTIRGHGVHSVYEDSLNELGKVVDVTLSRSLFEKVELVHVHTVGPIAAILALRSPYSVVTAHLTPDSLANSLSGGIVFSDYIKRYLRWFYNKSDVVIALSNFQRDELISMGVTSSIRVVPNFVPRSFVSGISRSAARDSLSIPDSASVVLSVGQIQSRKGVLSFHEAALDMPEVQFIWVGGFPFGILTAEYLEMRRLISNSPSNVWHTGRLKRKDIATFYAAADVYFHPSHQEHAPVSVLEAASFGLPLVLRELSCYHSIFQDKYLPGSDLDFSSQIRLLLDDRNMNRIFSERAMSISREYAEEHITELLLSVYRNLIFHS